MLGKNFKLSNFPLIKFFIFFCLFQGTPDKKITFTTQSNSGYADVNALLPKDIGARLVDGPSPLAGRLQLYQQGKWRSVCTNSKK